MARQLLTMALAVLLTGTLVWARCLDCDSEVQSTVNSQKHCCGQPCKTPPVQKKCDGAQPSTEAAVAKLVVAPPAIVISHEVFLAPVFVSIPAWPPLPEHSPPDLPTLHSSLLI